MPQTVDLAPRHLEAVRALLATHVPQAEVWAFGSRVSGGAHDGSDLDLVLRNPENLEAPISGRAGLIAAFQESLIPIFVEVHDWALLPPAFREEIQRSYTTITPAHDESVNTEKR